MFNVCTVAFPTPVTHLHVSQKKAMIEQLPAHFNPAWIRTGFSTKWCSDSSVTFPLAAASTFNKKWP